NIHEDTLWINQNPISALKELPFFILSGEDAGGGSPKLRLHDPHLRTALVWAAIVVHAALIVLAGRKIYRIIVSSDNRRNDQWTRRFEKNPAQVETLPSFAPAYLDSIVPAKPLDKLDLANTNRVWFLHLNGYLVRTVSEFLVARGFTLDKAAGSEIPSLLVFTRNQDFQPGFNR